MWRQIKTLYWWTLVWRQLNWMASHTASLVSHSCNGRTVFDMGYKCCMTNCGTGKDNKKKDENGSEEGKENETPSKKVAVFSFPDEKKDIKRRLQWIHFVNRKNFTVTVHTRICELHFEEHYLRRGDRTTLIHDLLPVPTIQTWWRCSGICETHTASSSKETSNETTVP